MKTVLLAAALAIVAIPGTGEARVWTVGRGNTDFPLIAPAIAHAEDGDEIRVGAGVYREDLVIAKRLSLVGEDRPILFGTGRGTVIDVRADNCVIKNLIIDGTGVGAGNQMDAAVRLTSSGNVVSGNVMRRVFYGVVIAGGSRNVVADNEIEGLLDLPFGRRGDGIYVYQGPRNHIVRNRVVGQRDAIFLQYAHHVRVEHNVVERSRYGLHDMFSDDTIVRDNVFRTSLVGANVMNSKRLTLERNEFAHNRGVTAVGLTLKDCDASYVSQNQFIGNARGLQLDGSARNRFVRNRFAQNDVAIRLLASAERNTFSGNAFAQNWSDVVESGGDSTNVWSDAGVGNRWSRYNGFDFDGDGVGDSAHSLLRPFERIEGANELARLYLQSPAAGALDLAARGVPGALGASSDRHPLTDTHSRGTGREWLMAAALLLLPLVRTARRVRVEVTA
jgi:nitrous oxide reductase family maturation protein NosD